MIERVILEDVTNTLKAGNKVVLIFGARQVGKTTLLKSVFTGNDVLWLTGDASNDRTLLSAQSIEQLRTIIGKHNILIIDEAQRINDIGIILKLLTDNIPQIKVIATGSSSFELANKTSEPLTGRKKQYTLFPLSYSEMIDHHGMHIERNMLEHRLIYGTYPEIVCSPGDERDLLQELSDNYLYKDILALDKIRKSNQLTHLLRALAYQIGNQVSYTELGQICSLDNKTIERYIDILEQTFVIFRLSSFSRNLRNELKKSRKIYFTDNGIRNAVISDFRPLELRNDIGLLWENYLVSERKKLNRYKKSYAKTWFWRTEKQQEIDYIEEKDACLFAYEFKWNPSQKSKIPKIFYETYPNSTYQVINRDNYNDFLTDCGYADKRRQQ